MPKLYFVLLLPALALFHVALVSVLLSLGYSDYAESISFNDADVFEVRAQEDRALAVVTDDIDEKNRLLDSSLRYWQQAIQLRPLWPYYYLGALDVDILLYDNIAAKKRIEKIIMLAPNERGIDSSLLVLSFIVWDDIEKKEQDWLLKRLSIVNNGLLKKVFFYAKQAHNQQAICAHLAWNKVKKLCSS